MNDTTTPTTPATDAAATPAKPKTVIEHMDSRRMFDTVEAAEAYLNLMGETMSDFGKHPQIINGLKVDDDGNATLDPEVYNADMRVMVAVLANRGEKGQPSTVKAIVVTPAPTIASILANADAMSWATRILEKEMNHVAVRALRNADDLESVQDQMPLTLADYITSGRESTGGIMESFNQLFKGIIASLAAKSDPWRKARLIKSELKRAMESTAYALATYPGLEDRGDKPSLFVMALQLGKREAEKAGLDPAIFDKWLATRDAKTLAASAATDEDDDFDLDELAFVSTESADAAAPATEGEATGDDSQAAIDTPEQEQPVG